MLTREEERELIVAWRERGDERALRRLIEQHRGLIASQARPFVSARAGMDDLMQHGAIGMKRAVEKFDLGSDNRLSTYARWFTFDEISSFGRKNSAVVTVTQGGMTGQSRKIWEDWSAEMLACAETGEDGTERAVTSRIAARLNVTEERVRGVVALRRVREQSLDAPSVFEDGEAAANPPAPLIENDTGEDELLRGEAARLAAGLLEDLMRALDAREADIIRKRKMEGLTLEQVSAFYGISRERVRQLEARAMEKMAAAGARRKHDARACLQEMRS